MIDNKSVIPQNAAQAIMQQVFAGMYEAIAHQVELSKAQLIQMMVSQLEKAFQEYIDTVAKKLDEFTLKSE